MHTDAILIRSTSPIPETALQAVPRDANLAVVQLDRWERLDASSAYAYFWLEPGTSVPDETLQAIRKIAGGEEAVRLALLMDLQGASAAERAVFHYVVETDVDESAEADFNAWYDQEHLPGLAAVPGTVRARRLRSLDGAPRYHACYELLSDRVLASPPWLAVRHTSWSDRVRPRFRNTRRAMFALPGR